MPKAKEIGIAQKAAQRDELLAALKSCDQIVRDVTLMMPERIVQAHNVLKAAIVKAEGN